ncbi:cupin domain-containing protein [Rhodococcus sp. MSC1_016]|jgi:quercetin dioxygenase-like cupin family protein|uniref:hypothetical protein n=1 Tax=Rhodococcus sp. MSC1_016 TaxID=2909266 RepID=UPI00202F15A7|nr:hypothetical protein [Rhodococcus sp. MSC1_016]
MSTHVHILRSCDGPRLTIPDADITVLVPGEVTRGAYEVFLVESRQGRPGPLHTEPWPKSYHLLRGRILVQAADTGYELAAGESITFPPGTMNTFTVLSESAEFLLVTAGAHMSGFFTELDALGRAQHSAEDVAPLLLEVANEYGITLASQAGAS